MKRTGKRQIIFLLCAVMVLSTLTGCGKKSDQEILTSSLVSSDNRKSVEADMSLTGKISMSLAGKDQDYDMSITANETIFSDPLKAKILMNTSVMGNSMQTESYLQKDKEEYCIYSKLQDSWYKTPLKGLDEAMQQLSTDTMKQLPADSSKYTKIEEKTEGDKTYHIYRYTMDSQDIKGEFEKYMGSLSSIASAGIDIQSVYNSIFEKVKTIEMTVWVDADNENIYRIEYPMTDLMNQVFEVILDSLSQNKSDAMKLSVSDMNMTITYKNYNSAADFDVPQEALEAKDLDLNSLASTTIGESEE